MNNDTHPAILGIDCSSTNLGWTLYRGRVIAHGEQKLEGDISARCAQAYNSLWNLLHDYPDVDALAIESPVARHAKAVIPQSRVSGALLALAAQREIPVVEVTPQHAKQALTKCGAASKADMLKAAAAHFGCDLLFLEIEERRGLWGAWMNARCVYSEHAADSLGVALAACKRVRVVAG